MKIAIIRQKYVNYGGAESFVQQYTEWLAEHGHEIHIFAHRWTPSAKENIHLRPVPVLTFNSLLRTLSFVWNAARAVRREEFDVVQSHEKTWCQDVYRAGDGCHRQWLVERGRHAPFSKRLLTALSPLHWLILALERRLVMDPGLKKIVAISEMVRQDFLRHYPIAEDKFAVVYNGVPLKRFHPGNKARLRASVRRELDTPEEEVVILFVGSGFERKGLRFLLASLSRLEKRGWRLWVVGKGKRRSFLEFAEEGVRDRVHFLDPVDDVEKYYAAADLFILPSIYEPFGNVYLEALASGLPVIASRMSGAAEIIEHGEDGLILQDPADTDEIARHIGTLFDEETRARMGRKARELAERYTPERNAREMLAIYEDVIRSR